MSIVFRVNAGVLQIKISGQFVFRVHQEFGEATKLVDKSIKQIEVDLGNTDYLDSSALGMLLMLRDKFAGKNTVQIKNAKDVVKNILEVVNFDKLFTFL